MRHILIILGLYIIATMFCVIFLASAKYLELPLSDWLIVIFFIILGFFVAEISDNYNDKMKGGK